MAPFIFHRDGVVAFPAARYQDAGEGEKEYVEKVVELLMLVWRLIVGCMCVEVVVGS
ncbi:hypothetical protein J0A71_08g18500 [Encephalitozoon cuniculi]|nr:hypothetical protein J0A71_08g18500 [Encephalitozoon cuniculi]